MTDPLNNITPQGELSYNPFVGPFVPASNNPVDSLTVATPTTSQTSAQAITIEQPNIDLLTFLNEISATKSDAKRTVFDSIALQANLFTDYYKGVASLLATLKKTYDALVTYHANLETATNAQINRSNNQNNQINNYNNSVADYNQNIETMNNEIAIFNAAPKSPASAYQAAINRYNQAVATYNAYRDSTILPGLSNFNTQTQNNYNTPTLNANQTTIPALNAEAEALKLGLPTVEPFEPDPATAAPTSVPQAVSYPTTTPIAKLGTLSQIDNFTPPDPAPSLTNLIDTYYTPFRNAILGSLKATSTALQATSAYRDFINSIKDNNLNLNPMVVAAYIDRAAKPSIAPAQGAGGTVSLATAISGLSSPDLERLLSAGMYTAFAAEASKPLPPALFDQLAGLSLSSLSLAALRGGAETLRLLANEPQNLIGTGNAISITTAGTFLESLIQIAETSGAVASSVIQDALKTLLPNLSESDALKLADSFAKAQGLSLVLLGVLAMAVAIREPNLLASVLKSLPPSPLINDILKETPFKNIQEALSDANVNTNLKLNLATSLFNAKTVSSAEDAVKIVNTAVDTTISKLQPSDTPETIKNKIAQTLITEGIVNTQAAALAQTGLDFIATKVAANNAAATQETSNQLLEGLSAVRNGNGEATLALQTLKQQLTTVIQNSLVTELGNTTATTLATSLANLIADQQNPNSVVNFMANRLKDYENEQSTGVREQLIAEFREFMKPQYLLYDTLRKTMDPADLFTHGRATAGIMYGNDSDPRKRGTALDIFV